MTDDVLPHVCWRHHAVTGALPLAALQHVSRTPSDGREAHSGLVSAGRHDHRPLSPDPEGPGLHAHLNEPLSLHRATLTRRSLRFARSRHHQDVLRSVERHVNLRPCDSVRSLSVHEAARALQGAPQGVRPWHVSHLPAPHEQTDPAATAAGACGLLLRKDRTRSRHQPMAT